MAQKTVFRDFIGYCPKTKVLEWLLEARELNFLKSDIRTCVPIGTQKAYKIFDELLKDKVIVQSVLRRKKSEKYNFYKLNIQEPRVKLLIQLFNACLKKEIKKYEKW